MKVDRIIIDIEGNINDFKTSLTDDFIMTGDSGGISNVAVLNISSGKVGGRGSKAKEQY